MLKSRFVLFLALGLLLLGVALFTFFLRKPSPVQTFPATVSRDCAPWDGAAFTIKISLEAGMAIDVSIWQLPDIIFPKTFTFPDTSGQVGNAILIHPVGLPEQLDGKVTLKRVQEGMPIEGRFNLTSERGGQFEGEFQAQWDVRVVMCG